MDEYTPRVYNGTMVHQRKFPGVVWTRTESAGQVEGLWNLFLPHLRTMSRQTRADQSRVCRWRKSWPRQLGVGGFQLQCADTGNMELLRGWVRDA